MKRSVLGCFFVLSLAVSSLAAENMIVNPGFELGSGTTTVTGWNRSGEVYREGWAYQSGSYGMAFHGWDIDGGVFWQDIACGGDIQLYYRMMTRLESAFPTHYFYQIITFYNSSSQVLGSHTNYMNLTSSNRDRWMTNSCNYTSPEDTVRARVEVRMPDQPSTSSSAILIDNMLLLPYTNTYRYGVTTESFVYDDSVNHPLHGENWGHGWSNEWATSGQRAIIEPGSLGVVDNYPVYAGAKMGLLPQYGSSEHATRYFSPIDRGKIYAAYEMTYSSQTSGVWCGAYMLDQGTNKFFWGEIEADYNRLGITSYPGATNQVAAGTADYGNGWEYVVVACYDFDTRELKFSRYDKQYYTMPLREPAEWDASMTLAPGQINSLNGIKMSAGSSSYSPSPCYFDEIRIATNWWNLMKTSPMDPIAHASNITFHSSSDNSIALSWQRGNGEGVLVVARETASPSNPSDGSTYSASSTFGNGSNLGSSSYVVYNGSGTNVTVTGLNIDTDYYFSIFEYNGQGSARQYNTIGEPVASESTSGQPEITVRGSSNNQIFDGDTTPSETDGTDFGPFLVGSTTSQTFTIENDGDSNLSISSIIRSGNTTHYSVSTPASSTVAPGGSTTFTVTYSPVSEGSSPATITISNNDSDEGIFTFTVQGDAQTNFLSYSTDALSFELYRGTLGTYTRVSISNSGYTNISYTNTITYHSSSDWLYITPSASAVSPTGTGSVDVYPRARLVEPGSYTATMTALSGNNNGAPEVGLSITVNEIPTLINSQITQPSYTTNVLSWQIPSGFSSVLILHRENAAITQAPSQNTYYGNGATIGAATVVYRGSDTSFLHTVAAGIADNYAIYTINNNHYSPAATLVSTPAAEAEIVLHGLNSNQIYDGDTTPSTTDGTDFGTFLVGSTTSRTFTIHNTGQQDLTISDISCSGNTTDYSITGPGSSTVGAGASTTFEITCNPQSESSTPATVTITNNDSDEGLFTFRIQTEAVSNYLAIGTSEMSFELYRGSIGSDHWIYITNRAPFSIAYTNTVEYNSSSNWIYPGTHIGGLSPHNSTITTIRPQAHRVGTGVGSFTAKLLVKSGNPNGDIEEDIAITINEVPTPQNVQLTQPAFTTNLLTWSLPVGFTNVLLLHRENAAITQSPNHGDNYSIGNTIGSATVVYKGSATTFAHTADAGAADNYALYVINNNHYSPAVTRASTPAGEAEIVIRGLSNNQIYDGDAIPSQSDGTHFGKCLVDSTNTQTFTIQNSGQQDLIINAVNLTGNLADYTIVPPATTTLGAGLSTTFDIIYSPRSENSNTVTVVINNNDSDESIFDFALGGEAVSNFLAYSTNQLNFELYRGSTGSDAIVSLHNSGPGSIAYTNSLIYHSGTDWIYLSPGTGLLGPLGSVNVSIRPQAEQNGIGSFTATLAALAGNPNSVPEVDLSITINEIPIPQAVDLSQPAFTTNLLTWQVPTDFTTILVLHSENTAASQAPVQGTYYANGATIGNATVIYKGAVTSLTHTVTGTETDHYTLYTLNNNHYSPAVTRTATAGDDDTAPPCIGPAALEVPASTTNNLLQNPGFETGSRAPWYLWSTGGGRGLAGWFEHSGIYHAWVGSPGLGAIYQYVTNYTGGGITWQASAWLSRESSLTSNNYLAIRFHDADGMILDIVTNTYVPPGYHRHTNVHVTAVSPENTAYASIYAYVDGRQGSSVLMSLDDGILQTPRPLRIRAGNRILHATGSHTDSTYFLTDGDIASISGTEELSFSFGAYDASSGLSRGTTDPLSQMNISVANWITNNTANYAASESSPYAETYQLGATSIWSFTSFPMELFGQTNAITATIYDADNDTIDDQQSLIDQPYGFLTVIDDDQTPPQLEALNISGSDGSNQVRVDELQDGSWMFTGTVHDADSGVNRNGTSISQPNCSPYYELVAPDGTIELTAAFTQLDFNDGEATTPAGISRVSHSTIANPVTGIWTARVYAADNDIDRGSIDQLVAVTTLVFVVTEAENLPPTINLPGPHILPVGSTTNFTVTGDDPDDHSYSLEMTQAPAGTTYIANQVSWTALPVFANTTNPLVFVINDNDGSPNSIVTNATTITVPYDHDDDTLADAWEWTSFATLAYGPDQDPDHDGADNLHEFMAGTAPNDNTDFFSVTNRAYQTSNAMTLTIPTRSGKTYTVEYSDENPSTNANWRTFNQNGTYQETGPDGTHDFTDTFNTSSSGSHPAAGRRYYRIRVNN